MNYALTLPKLSFIQVSKYEYNNGKICDYTNCPRPHYSLGLIIKGNAKFHFRNEIVSVKEGEFVFVPIGSNHVTEWTGNPDVTFISTHFSFEHPSPFINASKINIQKIDIADFDHTYKLYNKLLEEYDTGIQNQFCFISLFYEIMGKVYPNIIYKNTKKFDDRIKKAVDYIHQYYNQEFSNEDLAKLCNMSVSRFYSCFKEMLGMSPIEYKNTLLISQAKLMLIDRNNIKIENISEALGFNSTTYFRRLFKKLTGKSPTEYQNLERRLHSNDGI